MTVAETIEKRLTEDFQPTALTVLDESHKHAGHVGARPEGETHFSVHLVSDRFAGLNRVARQRLVYQALNDLMKSRIHALALSTKAPEEV